MRRGRGWRWANEAVYGDVPVTLGTISCFTAHAGTSTLMIGFDPSGYYSPLWGAGVDMSGRFFEADGVTPVRILSAVPEPSTMLLTLVPLAALAFRLRSSRNRA